MFALLAYALLSDLTPMDHLHQVVKALKGVVIEAEMVRPSNVSMTFTIAPGGAMKANYTGSVMYYKLTEQVTYMESRNQFSRSKASAECPVPPGFDALWPTQDKLQPTAEPKLVTFHDTSAWEQPCKASNGQLLNLYINAATWLPMGSVASANGQTYELFYKKITEKALKPADLAFRVPPGATPASSGPPTFPPLIEAGKPIGDLVGTDANGKRVSLKSILKRYPQGLVLNFWFCGCTGCVAEMPYLRALQPKLAKQGIGFLGVDPLDKAPNVRKTSGIQKLGYPTLIGPGAEKVRKAVNVVAYPVTVVIDRTGRVVDAIQSFDEDRLNKALAKLGYRG